MMFRSRAAQTTILAAGSAFALITATAGDRAHAEGNLDASYTISFARIPVGEITATAVFGQNEYAISARARAGGVLKALLVDGEASFSTDGTIKGDYPMPTTFTSKIVSKAESSDVTMVLEEGNVKELAVTPPPSSDLVVNYEPIAGHRANIPLVKYLSEGREIEIALAPIAGMRLLAPFRLSVVSTLANLDRGQSIRNDYGACARGHAPYRASSRHFIDANAQRWRP
jgi:hypothetical protein